MKQAILAFASGHEVESGYTKWIQVVRNINEGFTQVIRNLSELHDGKWQMSSMIHGDVSYEMSWKRLMQLNIPESAPFR